MSQHNIRNFCIIAHIDHGKSTLADRMLEITGTISPDKLKPQMLDRNPIERERGITIKLQPVRMVYQLNDKLKIKNDKSNLKLKNSKFKIESSLKNDNSSFILNLIDTPGHVDFSYEVSRSLAAVEGAILLVDATSGIQAQTLANLEAAQKQNLKIIPVINKIDLAHSEPERVALEVSKLLRINQDEIIFASGKTGEGVEEILSAIVEKIPPPRGKQDQATRALIFDSIFDQHRGVIVFVRIVDGSISANQIIKLIAGQVDEKVLEVGYFIPDQLKSDRLYTGEIGYVATGSKDIRKVRVGDTIYIPESRIKNQELRMTPIPLPGYKLPQPMVYASIFPISADDYPLLRDAISKYILTDGSLSVEPESSKVLGFGYRLGFLGLLHVDIVHERLKREYNLNLLVTTPQVEYEVQTINDKILRIHNLTDLPNESQIKEVREPWAKVEIISPLQYLGAILELNQSHRGEDSSVEYLEQLVFIKVNMPLVEIVTHLYDQLKSVSSGFASLAYTKSGFITSKLDRLDILINNKVFEAFSTLIPRSQVERTAKNKVVKLKEFIPRQQFEVKIQAAVGSHIIASKRVSALRKDVTAKLYGGDVTRKNKLLEAQKKGKERLKKFGNVDLPSDVFVKLLSSN